MTLAALRVLPVLAAHASGYLLDLRLSHGRLDVEHRPLVRVGQVELATSRGNPGNSGRVADLEELRQLDDLSLQAVFHPDDHSIQPPSLDVSKEPVVLSPVLPGLAVLAGPDGIVDVLIDHGPAQSLGNSPAVLELALDAQSLALPVEADPCVEAGAYGHLSSPLTEQVFAMIDLPVSTR